MRTLLMKSLLLSCSLAALAYGQPTTVDIQGTDAISTSRATINSNFHAIAQWLSAHPGPTITGSGLLKSTGDGNAIPATADDIINLCDGACNGLGDTSGTTGGSLNVPGISGDVLLSNGDSHSIAVSGLHYDSSTIGTPIFTGSGLNDCTFGGTWTGNSSLIQVSIQTAGTPDQVSWTDFFSGENGAVSLSSGDIALAHGMTVACSATTGHTQGAGWLIGVKPVAMLTTQLALPSLAADTVQPDFQLFGSISMMGARVLTPILELQTAAGSLAIGTLTPITTGSYNTILGLNGGRYTNGSYNTLLGFGNGANSQISGSNNVMVGASLGGGAGSFNVLLGSNISAGNNTGCIVIGSGAGCTNDNQGILGTGATTWTIAGPIASVKAGTYGTISPCANWSACGDAASGFVLIPAGTDPTQTITTTAAGLNSQIHITPDASLSTALDAPCNSSIAELTGGVAVLAHTAGSFTLGYHGTLTAPLCLSFSILN